MKKHVFEFIRRGASAMGLGPLVLAVFYLVLQSQGALDKLTVNEVALGIVSLSILAFIAGGMNCIYQIERLPLMTAILIHGGVLYFSYLATYLVNGWLETGLIPLLVFSVIFVVGFLVIWAIIYSIIRNKTDKLNEILKKKQQDGLDK
jgi:hypothetical protein